MKGIGEVKKSQFESSKNRRKISSTVLHLFHLYQAFASFTTSDRFKHDQR